MEGPNPRDAKAVRVNPADRLAKSKHAVHQVQMKFQDFPRIRVGTMMTVMEQGCESMLLLERQHAVHYMRIVPFMENDQIGVFQLVVEILLELLVFRFVKMNIKLGISAT